MENYQNNAESSLSSNSVLDTDLPMPECEIHGSMKEQTVHPERKNSVGEIVV
jgi:hypothetical protein